MTKQKQTSGSERVNRRRFPMVMIWSGFVVIVCLIALAAFQNANQDADSVRESVSGPDVTSGLETDETPNTPVVESDAIARARALMEERNRLDQTIWKDEVLSQEYEEVFVNLWDELRATKDPLGVIGKFSFRQLVFGALQAPVARDLGISVRKLSGLKTTLDMAGWQDRVASLRKAGFEIVQTEWHHARFDPSDTNAIRSTVKMTVHILNRRTNTRYILNGPLEVVWEARAGAEDLPRVGTMDATSIEVLERSGEPAFRMAYKIQPKGSPSGGGKELPDPMQFPIHLYDMNQDGLSEIIVPSLDVIYLNQGDFNFLKYSLFKFSAGQGVMTGVFADFTGDGRADYLYAAKGPLILFQADEKGQYSLMPSLAADASVSFINASVFTAGDIDGDGDLDVWVGQYKSAYEQGQMPTPYYDANDGFPDFLFKNDGTGHFTDATEEAGLGKKRFRRTYGASLIDLDEDLDLDLVVCCDFAGLDIYLNDGRGTFTDVTESHVDLRHSFGMSLSFADYNLDGKTDIFMTGMGSTTARRLEQLKLGRDEFPLHQAMRMPMGYGNRMYLAADSEDDGATGRTRKFMQAPFNDSVSRTGWSWGATSFDFDNDGDRDTYVANGFLSKGSAKDYCTYFWRQDIYMGNSTSDAAIVEMHKLVVADKEDMSWNGFEHNCLLMNEGGSNFVNVAFLMDVAFEYDSRGVVSDDLDGDGRPDLVVYKFSTDEGFPFEIHVLENQLVTDHHWIGVRLHEEQKGHSAMGASVVLRTAEGTQVTKIVSGDSYYAQHSPTAHFGLGPQTEVESIEVTWINGTRLTLENPAVDQYHAVRALRSETESAP